MDPPIRVAVIDDHPFVQTGIQMFLIPETNIVLVGTGMNATDAQTLCRTVQPDVLLLDVNMPNSSAVDIITFARQHCPQTKVLVFSAYNDPATVRSVVNAGIAGYVLKEESPELLLHAIRTVVKGATWFSRSILDQVVLPVTSGRAVLSAMQLTEREWDILEAIVRGWNNARIATTLHLSEQTIRNYATRIYDIIGVRSRTEAVLWGIQHGMGTASNR